MTRYNWNHEAQGDVLCDFQVFETREELQQEARRAVPLEETVCLTAGEYKGLVGAVMSLATMLLLLAIGAAMVYRRYWSVIKKNISVDRTSTRSTSSYPPTRSSGFSSSISMFSTGLHKPFTGKPKKVSWFPQVYRFFLGTWNLPFHVGSFLKTLGLRRTALASFGLQEDT